VKKITLFTAFVCLVNIASTQITYFDAFPNLDFNFPVEIQNSGISGDDRIFVVEQNGRIEVFDNDMSTTSSNTFLDITSVVNFNSGTEKGLLGLAFHPNYDQNGYFYVYYTGSSGGLIEIVVERYTVNAANPNVANPNSACEVISFVKNQSNSNHNGGAITFGSDGYLYISVGDGGGGGDPQDNSQNINNLFGTILRLDIDANCPGYAIPPSNPFASTSGADEIYCWGIRNTWKMSFDFTNNILVGGDVGQNAFEEINDLTSGGNFGWNRYEAFSVFDNSTPDDPNAIFPIHSYNRNQGDRSITGGYFYRGNDVASANPSIFGKYIYGDYVSGRVWSLEYNPQTGMSNNSFLFQARDASGSTINISSFGTDIFDELYFAAYGSSGKLYKFDGGVTQPNANQVNGFGIFCEDNLNVNGIINDIEYDGNGNVYIAGDFNSINNITVNNIGMWNGNTFVNLGNGLNGIVYDMAVSSSGQLFIGGNFSQINGITANNVAVYNGNNWNSIGAGTDGTVLVVETDSNNEVYFGGTFINANNITANNIASWDGNWQVFADNSTGIRGTNNEIRTIAFDENDVMYIGGNFGSAGGKTANRIASWNGTTWGTLGNGTSGFVQAIVVDNNYIYAGGNFAIAQNTTVNRIARFNRATLQWEKIENGLTGIVNDLTLKNNFLYVAGTFDIALNNAPEENIFVNSVCRWNVNSGWQALGALTNVGVDNILNTIEFENDQMWIGGTFNQAGNLNNTNLAIWDPVSYGMTCDDFMDCTTGEFIDEFCNCTGGTFADADQDGVCDSEDICNGFDDMLIGTSCSDGDNCTEGETYTSNCICEGGTLADDDNDGVCNGEDICNGSDDNLDADNDGIPNGCDTDCICDNNSSFLLTFQINDGNNDIEENSGTGSINFSSSDLDIIYDDDDINTIFNIGLRFEDVDIPANANIINAYLKFTVDEVSTVSSNFEISIENTTASSAFTNTNFNLNNRNFYTNTVMWNNVPNWNAIGNSSVAQESSNITSLIDYVRNLNSWTNSNRLTFKITGTGSRIAKSFNGSSTEAPKLMIEYELPPCLDDNNNGILDNCEQCPNSLDLDSDNDGICDSDEFCSQFDIINNNAIINYNINVTDFIENNGKIPANSNIEFTAENYIELTNNFEVSLNTTFEAIIEVCGQ